MKYIILSLTVIVTSFSFSQTTIARQSINSIGGSHTIEGVRIEQSIGQPHQTKVEQGEQVTLQPGFIQPRTFFIESISNELTVPLTIYPNPATESFTLRAEENIEVAQLFISDLAGNKLEEIQLTDFRSHKVNCSEWSNGTYIISFVTSNGRKNNSKLIITK